MLLAYQLLLIDRQHIGLRCFSLDIREGERWMGTPYPLRTDSVIAGKARGIQVGGLDQKILMSMQMHQKIRGDQNLFQGADTSRLIESLLKSKRAYPQGKNPPPLTLGEPQSRDLVWQVTAKGFELGLALAPPEILIPGRPCYVLNPETGICSPVTHEISDLAMWKWVTAPLIPLGKQAAVWQKFADEFPAYRFPHPPDTKIQTVSHIKPVPKLAWVEADKIAKVPESLRISFNYGALEVLPDTPGAFVRWLEKGTIMEAARDLKQEQALLKNIMGFGLLQFDSNFDNLFAHSLSEPRYELNPKIWKQWSDFMVAKLPDLQKAGWQTEVPERFHPHWIDDQDWYSDFNDAGTETLRYEQGIEVNGQRLNLLPVLYGFLKQRRERSLAEILAEIGEEAFPLSTEQGLLMISGSRFQQMVKALFELFGEGVLDRENRLRISPWRAAELHDGTSKGWAPSEALLRSMEALSGTIDINPMSPPADFQGELRDYQKQGLGWIDFLASYGLGGILADDMGLGKTVQVIAAMLHLRGTSEKPGQFLVVSPASVLPNWRAELKRFAPGLTVHTHHGNDRHADADALDRADVLLTTYGTLLRDEVAFKAIAFQGVILDEAQVIKNAKARITKMVGGLNAGLRLALSGTPLENHLGELRSLFHFVMPGYLGTEKMFNAAIRRPIEKEDAAVAKKVLHQKISPLLLRRSKDLVAGELPPKTEMLQELPLSTRQADLYEVVRAAGEQQMIETLKDKGFERSRIQVLDLLLKLRQICCDPRLCKAVDSHSTAADAVKLQWLRDVLPEMVEEGRRILLFSQFTSMLDLIRVEIDDLKIPYVEIRGSTQVREAPVQKFQAGEVPLFLISIKAGGTGLNLTAADTVIFFDPWWNPAVEAQATDRAHRIGQDKPVFVYKLICAGTVESRILELQERKKALQEILDAEESVGMKKFTEEDFKSLMAPLSTEKTPG
jgi:superfamily II DNA or RNA helicase